MPYFKRLFVRDVYFHLYITSTSLNAFLPCCSPLAAMADLKQQYKQESVLLVIHCRDYSVQPHQAVVSFDLNDKKRRIINLF